MPPSVSVCMPACRDHAWFRAALRGVLEQSYDDLEVIVSDDSGGGLRAAADEAGDSRIRYLAHSSRLGLAGNHQAAIDASRGQYVAFLHDDDEWDRDHLRRAVAVLDREPDVGVVISACDDIDEHGARLRRRATAMRAGTQKDALSVFLHENFTLMLPSVSVFRKAALDAANRRPWPDVQSADGTMFIDVAACGWLVHYTGHASVRYRVHTSQLSSEQLGLRDSNVKVWSGYAFPDHGHEQLRRRRLAKDLIARAGELVRRGELLPARQDLDAARQLSPWAGLRRAIVLRVLVRHPRLTPAAERLRGRGGSRVPTGVGPRRQRPGRAGQGR